MNSSEVTRRQRAGLLLVWLVLTLPSSAQSSGEILQRLLKLRVLGSVLYVAAHPDDENTEVLAYLAKERHYDTVYLSLTRGEGGQNLIGPEQGVELAALRTEELLQARRIDGAYQMFAEAADFGFSRHPDEALSLWDRRSLVDRLAQTVRSFQPDLIITRFSPRPGPTHGHHTASAILTRDAFAEAGDPEMSQSPPWQAKRLLWNVLERAPEPQDLELWTGGFNPLLGVSYPQLAARGRSVHQSQSQGTAANFQKRLEHFEVLAGEPADRDIMDGVDTSWSRVRGGEAVDRLVAELIKDFDAQAPHRSVAGLLRLRKEIRRLPDQLWKERKLAEVEALLVDCLGLHASATTAAPQLTPGQTESVEIAARTTAPLPIEWRQARLEGRVLNVGRALSPVGETRLSTELAVAASADLHGLVPEPEPPRFLSTSAPSLVKIPLARQLDSPPVQPLLPSGLPATRSWISAELIFELEGEFLTLTVPLEHQEVDARLGERRWPLAVLPPVSLRGPEPVVLFQPGQEKPVAVDVQALAPTSGPWTLKLGVPVGWKVRPEKMVVEGAASGGSARQTFLVTPPEKLELLGAVSLYPQASVEGRWYGNDVRVLDYPHFPRRSVARPAEIKALVARVKTAGRRVGYLPGSGDRFPEALRQLGYQVELLDPDKMTLEALLGCDAILIGVRAFNVVGTMPRNAPLLFEYVHRGGTLVVAYQSDSGLRADPSPLPLELSSLRVTDESAPVTLSEPVLAWPNLLTEEDFNGWVQERALQVPKSWDPAFAAPLSIADPGEQPLRGTLLIAPYGQGLYVYTSLSLFRQLPAGVPGAYRLLANLVSAGQDKGRATRARSR